MPPFLRFSFPSIYVIYIDWYILSSSWEPSFPQQKIPLEVVIFYLQKLELEAILALEEVCLTPTSPHPYRLLWGMFLTSPKICHEGGFKPPSKVVMREVSDCPKKLLRGGFQTTLVSCYGGFLTTPKSYYDGGSTHCYEGGFKLPYYCYL